VASLLIGLSTAVVVGCLFYLDPAIAGAASLGVFAIGLVLALAMWIPFLCMIAQTFVLRSYKLLSYPKIQAEEGPPKKPDWLYGDST
jgi:hypothetical protein